VRDTAAGTEGARAEKYSAEQAEYSRSLLGRDPEGAELRAHHAVPADGVVTGDVDDACPHCGAPAGGASL
jgi:hypothetical protein